MKLRSNQINQHLKKASQSNSLLPLYIVSGEDPLLMQESCDLLRMGARAAGFSERELYSVESGFDWNQLLESTNSMSLFGDRKLIEIRLTKPKLDEAGKKALATYLTAPSQDNLIILTMGKLDRKTLNTKWFQAMENSSALIQIWPIENHQLPQWVQQRMESKGLHPSPDASQLLAERVEGNLLAAAQEVEKLALLIEPGPVNISTIRAAVANHSRYTQYELVDHAIKGNDIQALKILNFLENTGVEPIAILWALSKDLRALEGISTAVENGQAQARAFKDFRVWDNRKPLFHNALKKHRSTAFRSMLIEASYIDHSVKGLTNANPWIGFRNIILMLSGTLKNNPLPLTHQ
ncbi:DNA polymerase III subunit delta [Gammaproteobacteria bacterium 45_16_T64]|nr:DNA polymerase III subunit delta [Gammaproteobacteria bacterium 45_16_T64]